MERPAEMRAVVVLGTLALSCLLLYLVFRRGTESLIVMLSLPFARVGGVWLMWRLDYNVSVAVIVGFIALAGVAAETGVVMLIYLDHALEAPDAQRPAEGRSMDARDLRPAIIENTRDRSHTPPQNVYTTIWWTTETGTQ